jgi:menaquinone-9 beta-reductase
LHNNITRQKLEENYTKEWKNNFGTRVRTGKLVQYLFGQKIATNIFIALMKRSKILTNKIITHTHGKEF